MATSNELFLSNSKNYNMESIIGLRNIMLTGYWNPTGQMIAEFSTDPYLNPDGWNGENWEGLGYDIYSFFPTPYIYNGTFEVDYQDTWEDFWNITADINPIAIISFGAGNGPWEIEYNARNLDSWIPDNVPPNQPTPCPPDDSEPPGYVRHSTLPVQAIADAVNEQTNVNAWIDWNGNPGAYLCEYIAYLGMWYQDIHNESSDPYRCWEAGFVHVKSSIDLEDTKEATKVTIREVIKSLPNNPPETPIIHGDNNLGDDVHYLIDWDDGTTEWTAFYPSGQPVEISHEWSEPGLYHIRAKAKDIYGAESDWSDPFNVTISNPPNKPDIIGPTRGKVGVSYEFTFVTTDPDGDNVSYYINWDDGDSDETGLYSSGTDVKVKHTWQGEGTYTIRAFAKDEFGLAGPEGTLTVTITKGKNRVINSPFQWFLEQHPYLFPILQKILLLQR
jgi:pyrrolidone-carboxylate peptidase